MAGLRVKQKEERQRRILEAARQQFRSANYRDVTIEGIAEKSNLSAMTVFNYYGSKGGILLSLVAESDRYLITKIDELLEKPHEDAIAAVTEYSLTIFNHAFSYLDRKTWRHVLSTSILEGNSTFGKGFSALEQELKDSLFKLLEQLKQKNLVNPDCDSKTAACVIYNVHNMRFIQFSADQDILREEMEKMIIRDLGFVMGRITSE